MLPILNIKSNPTSPGTKIDDMAQFDAAARATATTVVTHPVRGSAGATSGIRSRLDHTGASTSIMIPSELALYLLYIFAFLEGHAAISPIVLTFASDVCLQTVRRLYMRSELVRLRTLAELESREHVQGKHDPRQNKYH